ncbi:hypothetical protein HZC32_02045 [Candidatus Woesearchaeota archaeon]|nr:hypothetical protein [Candidatus Woesearchaeota archaeon]
MQDKERIIKGIEAVFNGYAKDTELRKALKADCSNLRLFPEQEGIAYYLFSTGKIYVHDYSSMGSTISSPRKAAEGYLTYLSSRSIQPPTPDTAKARLEGSLEERIESLKQMYYTTTHRTPRETKILDWRRKRREHLTEIIAAKMQTYLTPALRSAVSFLGCDFDLFSDYNYPGGIRYALKSDGSVHCFKCSNDRGTSSVSNAASLYLDILMFAKHRGKRLTEKGVRADVEEDLGLRVRRLIENRESRISSGDLPERFRPDPY